MSSAHTNGSSSSTSTHNSISFLRVPKSGLGGKAKGKNAKKSGQREEYEEGQEEWYIPYKGPYEPAPGLKKRERSRDSWGDPVPGSDGVDSHQGAMDERSDPQQRSRSQSHTSQPSSSHQPHSLRSDYPTQSPKISSYINLDAAGGVGGSPVPHSSSFRHMQHDGGGADGMGRPWSAREARGREGSEEAGMPRTLKQRSSLASLFEKKYTLLKKLSKLGLGAEGGANEGEAPVDRGQPPPRPPRQRPPSRRQQSSPARPPPAIRDDYPGDDIMVVPRSPKSEPDTRSVSVYSQPSPFVSSTQLKSLQRQEEPKDKEWTPIVRLTPPPEDTTSTRPLTASTVSSFASKQRRPLSSDSYSNSHSRSRSNSQSHSQHSVSAPAPVPLATIVDEDDSHVESYYDMLITSSVPPSPPLTESRTTTAGATSGPSNGGDERHPYACAVTFPSGHVDPEPEYSYRAAAGKQKTRLSPIPQSRPSLATLKSFASSPDLSGRRRGPFGESDGVDMSRLRPHVREKLQSTGGRGKERWLSTGLIAIFLPKPKFKINANSSTTDLTPHQGPPVHVPQHMAEFGAVPRLSDVQEEPPTTRRKSYAYDDLSLLSLDRVLEERDRLEQDRIKWQAQAVKSLGNRHARIVSRSRSKSLTQTGRKMTSVSVQQQQQQQRYHHTRGQQSSIDYLAARACLGDQDLIPVVDEDDTVVDINPTPNTVRRLQFEFPKHERLPSGSSGPATSSGGHRSSSARSESDNNNPHHHHKRNDSWSRSAVRIAKSLPQICGVVQDDDEDDNKDQSNNKRILHQLQPTSSPEVNGLPTLIMGDNRKPSPSPSSLVGVAISTPPDSQEPAYRDYHHHPYTIGAYRGVADSKRKDDDDGDDKEPSGRAPSDIRLPDHPYAQGGLSSSISRCVAGEREPDYVGPHRAVAVAMTKELMANLGLSELSARHRLPPQVLLAQHLPPVIQLESASQNSQPPQKPKASNQLYVKVDDTRNSYQDLQPYVRADSNTQPPDRLWVTYSPGIVREVMPNEVFQYSPHISNPDVTTTTTQVAASPVSASSEGTDFFLQRYQRMSTVYQDTVTMSQALGNAMYDSSDARRKEHHESTTDTSTFQEHQVLASRYTATTTTTTPPRVLFGPRLNTTQSASNLSVSRVSSPILPRPSPSTENQHSSFVVFADPFPPRGRGAVSAASPVSGTSTSPSTSPTVPRPDNLEPFHGLFYRPPEGSETDSPAPSPSPYPDEEEDVPSHPLLDDAQWTGSGLTSLMKEVNDELEQMVLERERSGSIRSESTLQSQRPSTSDSMSTSTTSKGGSAGGVRRSRRINTEAGPLDFVLDRQQDPPTTQSGYVPRPNRVSTFYPSTPIPEDIEFSRASSPFEGTVEDETVRLPAGSNNQTGTAYPTEEEYLALYHPDGVRASYHTTTDTLSRISALSEFPVPPNEVTPEEVSILTTQPQ